jgi:glycosyltransferase involved in cell wall biosynthesis
MKDCVNSILAQSYSDFQLIVLDNCSSDGSREWIDGLNDKRIVLYPSGTSLTIERNWNRIISIPKAEFMTMIGHDDLLEPDYLSVMDELIRAHPRASVYQTHFKYIDSRGALIRACKPMDETQSAEEFLAFFLCSMIDVMGTGFMMRSADYDAVGGIPPRYPNLLFADFELLIRLSAKNYKATSMKQCFSFRLHQSMTTTSSDIRFHQAYDVFIEYLKTLKNEPGFRFVIERYALDFIRYYTKGMSHRLIRSPKSKREGKTVKLLLAQSKKYADDLVPGNDYNPRDALSVKLATAIDSNILLGTLFRTFRKAYSKPLYS